MTTRDPPAMADRTDEDEAVDLSTLRAQTGGDPNLEREVLGIFLKRCESELGRLKAAETADERRQIAHGLVGTAAAVGAGTVARLARSVERGNTVAMVALEAAIAAADRQIRQYLAE